MQITTLAGKLDVNTRDLKKALLESGYLHHAEIVEDDIAETLLYLFEYYSSQLTTPEKIKTVELKIALTPCIYFLFAGSSITYIGQSLNIFNRLGQHIKDKVFDGIAIIEVPRKDLEILELFYISKHTPHYNKDGISPISKILKLIKML
jgi:hypothetical protein